jgi:hypothetical protein
MVVVGLNTPSFRSKKNLNKRRVKLMRPLFNFKSTKSIVSKAVRKKSASSKTPHNKNTKKKNLNDTHLLSQSVLNFAKASFVVAITVVFIVLACLGKIDTAFFNTLVGTFSPFL